MSGPSRWRKPGEKLHYVDGLTELGAWPPKTRPGKPRNKDRPPATPFLIIPAFTGDVGVRPLPGNEGVHSGGLQLVDANGVAVQTALPGQAYRLQATLRNLGATASYAGLIDFYLAPAAALDAAALGGPAPPAFTHSGFTLPPQGTTTVTTAKTWTPANAAEAQLSLLARAWDLALDPLGNGFDARGNRHVARHDAIADFSGVWDGVFISTTGWRSTLLRSLFRVIITQNGSTATCQFFEEVGFPPALPSTPQSSGSGPVIGTTLALITTDHLANNVPFTTNHWTLSLPDSATLHVENVHTFPPGDARPTQHWVADLHRI